MRRRSEAGNRPARPRLVLALPAALLALSCAAAAAPAKEWVAVGSFALREPELARRAADLLFPPGSTDEAGLALRALLEATGGRPFAGRLLSSRESGEVALVAAHGGPAAPETARAVGGLSLVVSGDRVALSSGDVPDPAAVTPPSPAGTAAVECALDLAGERERILAALRARDLTIQQRAAVEEAVAPWLAQYPAAAFSATRAADGFRAVLRLAGPGFAADRARLAGRGATGRIAAAVPREGLVAWYYDVDDHAERFRGPFLAAFGGRGTSGDLVAAEAERAFKMTPARAVDALGNELLVALRAAPAGTPFPSVDIALAAGDPAAAARVGEGGPPFAAALGLEPKPGRDGAWSFDPSAVAALPFVKRIFVRPFAGGALLSTRETAPGGAAVALTAPEPGALLAAEFGVDLARLAAECRRPEVAAFASSPEAARVVSFLAAPGVSGVATLAVVHAGDALELRFTLRKGNPR